MYIFHFFCITIRSSGVYTTVQSPGPMPGLEEYFRNSVFKFSRREGLFIYLFIFAARTEP